MNESVRDRVLRYFCGHNVMTLATMGSGGPWAAAVFYVNDGFTLNFLSAVHTRHASNMASNSGVAATVQEDYGNWRDIKGIQLEGHVTRLLGRESSEAKLRFETKFFFTRNRDKVQPEWQRALEKVTWYVLIPEKMFFIDNSVEFGHREEVSLPQFE